MADMCDGQAFATHPLYSLDHQALQIVLYDDLEICNPLGPSVKKHKLGKNLIITLWMLLFVILISI